MHITLEQAYQPYLSPQFWELGYQKEDDIRGYGKVSVFQIRKRLICTPQTHCIQTIAAPSKNLNRYPNNLSENNLISFFYKIIRIVQQLHFLSNPFLAF